MRLFPRLGRRAVPVACRISSRPPGVRNQRFCRKVVRGHIVLAWLSLLVPLIGAAGRAQTLTTLYSFSGSTPETDYNATTADIVIGGSTLFGVSIAPDYEYPPVFGRGGVYSLPVTGGRATYLLAFSSVAALTAARPSSASIPTAADIQNSPTSTAQTDRIPSTASCSAARRSME